MQEMYWFAILILAAAQLSSGQKDVLETPAGTINNNNNNNGDLSPPYMENGKICQEKEETIEEMEHDDEIRCDVQLKELCDDHNNNKDDDVKVEEACHTMFKKECDIFYRPHMTKMKVKVCPNVAEEAMVDTTNAAASNSIVMDVRSPPPSSESKRDVAKCRDGQRVVCVTRHETECGTEYTKQDMEEDHPRCRVQLVEKCRSKEVNETSSSSSSSKDELSLLLLQPPSPPSKKECEMVPAMRCRIEKMMVTKTKPETKCRRIPRQFCRKESCNGTESGSQEGRKLDEGCYFRTQIVNEVVPEEQCSLIPHRVCHPVQKKVTKRDASAAVVESSPDQAEKIDNVDDKRKSNCRFEPVESCKMTKVNGRPVTKKMRKKVCRDAAPAVAPGVAAVVTPVPADPAPSANPAGSKRKFKSVSARGQRLVDTLTKGQGLP